MKKVRTWWLLSIVGIIFIAVGTFSFLSPHSAYIKLLRFSGLALLINGLLLLVASVYAHTSFHKERNWMLAESVVDFLFGILLAFNPIVSWVIFPFLLGYWILAMGVIKICTSISLRKNVRGWRYIFATGVLFCIFGFLIVYFPFVRAHDITVIIGAFGLIMGSLILFESFRFRNTTDTLNMIY